MIQGPGGSQRIGNNIKILSVEMAGRLGGDNADTDVHIVCPKIVNDVPNTTYFSQTIGAFYDSAQGWMLFRWGNDTNHENRINFGTQVYKFPQGMDVHFNENNPVKNALYLCITNWSGVNAINISGTIRLRYVDA